MLLDNILKVGNKLELSERYTVDGRVETKNYQSQIADIIDDENIEALMPVYEGRLIPLEKGSEFDAYISSGGILYNCKVLVTNRYKNGNIYLVCLRILTDIKKYQRREYYRFDIGTDFAFKPISNMESMVISKIGDEPESVATRPQLRAVTIDISGGGLKYVTTNRNAKGEIILVFFDIPTNTGLKKLKLQGRVLQSTMSMNRPGVYEERLEFFDVRRDDRDSIVKYIFEMERKRRQKQRGQ